MKKALLVIDLQNDYFPGGNFPLWNTDVVLQNIERAIVKSNAQGIPVIHIQHVAKGVAPFFNEGTTGNEFSTMREATLRSTCRLTIRSR